MTDAIGAIGNSGRMLPEIAPLAGNMERAPAVEPAMKDALHQQIEHVNAMQQDVKANLESIAADRRSGIESVLAAARQADAAFETLQEVRSKVLSAYQRATGSWKQ